MTNNTIAAIPTTYAGVNFRSRLETKYAAFFDIVGWKWEYEPPIDLPGWIPDFKVTLPCSDPECNHALLVEVKPYMRIDEFKDTPEYELTMNGGYDNSGYMGYRLLPRNVLSVALFGNHPGVSFWLEPSHENGGGEHNIPNWVRNWESVWKKAGNIIQWKKSR